MCSVSYTRKLQSSLGGCARRACVCMFVALLFYRTTEILRLVANTGAVNMTTFDVFLSVLLSAPSPALPEAMAGATSIGGYLAAARATQLVDIVR